MIRIPRHPNSRASGVLCRIAAMLAMAILGAAQPLPVFGASDESPYDWGATPEWVVAAPAGAAAGQAQSDNAFDWVDYQIRVDRTVSSYIRIVENVQNTAQRESASQLSLDIDPANERLHLHSLRVIRDGVAADYSKRARYSLLQRESELESGVVDGVKTLHVILEDIRVGDRVDYSYTVDRTDPLEDHRFHARYLTAWSEKVRHFRLRMLYDASRKLQFRDHSGLAPPQQQARAGWIEKTWYQAGIAAVKDESGTPSSYLWRPMVEVSEFANWEELRQWAMPLYVVKEPPSAEIRALLAELRALPDDTARIERALRFVQEDVRYTGLEIGPGAYRPTPPNQTVARRYGDCKDKTLLLVYLLDSVQIKAMPALVHTSLREGIAEGLPRPGVFNHVITRVESGGKVYWLDGTRMAQGTRLDTLAQADFGRALVVAPGQTGLAEIPAPTAPSALAEVEEIWDLTHGLEKTASLTVRTIYRGDEAESFRATMRSADVKELADQYLNFYRKRHAGIQISKPLKFEDRPETNQYEVTEYYSLPETFARKEGEQQLQFQLFAYLIDERTPNPEQGERKTPLALSFPSHVSHRMVVRLPEEWSTSAPDIKLEEHGLRYRSSTRAIEKTLVYQYELETTADRVSSANTAGLRKTAAKIRDDLYPLLTYSGGATMSLRQDLSWRGLLAALLGLLGGGWAVHRWIRWQPPAPAPARPGAPKGIAGWLALILLGIVISPFYNLFNVWGLRNYLHDSVYSQVVNDLPMPWLTPVISPVLFGVLALSVAVTVMVLYLPLPFFRRETKFPSVYLIVLWTGVTSVILDAVFCWLKFGAQSKDFTEATVLAFRESIFSTLWTVYMLRSQRVRATFTRRVEESPDEAAVADQKIWST